MAMLKIYTASYPSGIDLLPPNTFKVSLADLDSEKTTRTAKGTMVRDVIRSRVRSIELGWGYLTRAQMVTLLGYFNCDAQFTRYDSAVIPKGFISLNYPDPSSSTNITKTFYPSDRSTPLFNFALGKWEGLTLTLVER
jgi:hypothetical protein